jgi:YVTN family beta-propeller protein
MIVSTPRLQRLDPYNFRPMVLFPAVVVLIVWVVLIDANRRESREDLTIGLTNVVNRFEKSAKDNTHAGYLNFMSPHDHPIAICRELVLVANTPCGTVDVIEAGTREVVRRIEVGVEPVCVMVRPDGNEVWVSNHVSDTVSVIDSKPGSPTYLKVVATIQEIDPQSRATQFDEPVGIAFAGNKKAYVALSAENQVAVIDVASRKVIKRLMIPAQDPRSIVVKGNRLLVIPFESGNKTQLSGGSKKDIDGDLVTFDIWNHSVANNNVLSLGHVVDIVKHPLVPDRDLFVFDTESDELITTVDSLGTLLYGVAAGPDGDVYITQTDARNDVNGRSGSRKHGLEELQNRAFLNRITRVSFDDPMQGKATFIDLETLPPVDPQPGMALATPFAIAMSSDGKLAAATASGSDQLFLVDTETQNVIGRVPVGAVPEGIVLQEPQGQIPLTAWVYNAGSNSVSIVNLNESSKPIVEGTVELVDPTPPELKRGRIAFSSASASSSGTFSCASCHPDGHTDQLLWVLKTPVVTGGDQIMPRSTMPVRGLRDTEPFHWDGIPGDPYGGINSAHVLQGIDPNSELKVPESSIRHLIDGGLASTMLKPGSAEMNEEGKPGRLGKAQRDDMAKFLLSIPYPPAPKRAFDDQLSEKAKTGFSLFHLEGDEDPSKPTPNRCGDCHRFPFLVSTNTPGTGMDAPTWRGAYDRWLILPQGRLNVIALDFFERIAKRGTPEKELWQLSWAGRGRFNPVWDMVLEMGTGFPGAFGRQVTISGNADENDVHLQLLDAMEQAASEGRVRLQASGVLIGKDEVEEFAESTDHTGYISRKGLRRVYQREELVELAKAGRLVATFTARLGHQVLAGTSQPAIWTLGPIEQQRGRQEFPSVSENRKEMSFSARHLEYGAMIVIDGRKADGQLRLEGDVAHVSLASVPARGIHFLQVQNPNGLVSNELIFHVTDRVSRNRWKGKNLADVVEETGWGRLLGRWVDKDTRGEGLSLDYQWSLAEHLIGNVSKDAGNESYALIGLDATTGQVYHKGGDRHGSAFEGHWEMDEQGDALLDLKIHTHQGGEATLRVRYHFVSDDEMNVVLDLPEQVVIPMVRAKD